MLSLDGDEKAPVDLGPERGSDASGRIGERMSRGRRIALNTVFLSAAQVMGAVLGIVVVGRVAAILGPTDYGMLEGAISYVSLFTPIVFAGIQLILIRDVCEKPEIAARAVGDALLVRAALLPVFVGCVVLFLPDAIRGYGWPLLAIGLVNGFLIYYLQCFELIFEAFERMWVMAVAVVACYAVGITGSYVAAVLGWGPVGVLAARASSVVVQTLVLVVGMRVMFFAPAFEIDVARCAGHLRRGLPLLVSVALNMLLLEVGRTTLASARPAAEVGLYSTAATLSSKFLLFIHALTQAVQPGLCKSWIEGSGAYADLLGRALRFVLLLTLPMGLGALFVADDLIVLIFGDEYREAGGVMTILMFAVHLQFLSHVLNASVVARGRENMVLVGAAIAVGVNATLAALLIPTHGTVMAAAVTVLSQVVLVLFFSWVQRDNLPVIVRQLKLVRVGLANAVLVGVCILTRDLGMFVIIPAAAAAYALAILGLRCIDRAEIRAITGR